MPGKNTTGLAQTSDYNLGRGTLYAAEIDTATGKPKEYRMLGNSPEFNVSVETEVLDHFASLSGLKTKDKSVTISQGMGLSFGLEEINFENLAMFFAGTQATHVNPAKSAQANIILATSAGGGTGVVLGRWYDLVDANGARLYDIVPGNLTVQKDPAGTPTNLVSGTDYELDAAMGRIFIKHNAVNIVAGNILGYDYSADANAKDCDEVRALTKTNVVLALKFIGENPANADHKYEFQFHQVSVRAEGDFGLISDEYSVMNFSGTAEKNTLASPNSPTLTIRTHADAHS